MKKRDLKIEKRQSAASIQGELFFVEVLPWADGSNERSTFLEIDFAEDYGGHRSSGSGKKIMREVLRSTKARLVRLRAKATQDIDAIDILLNSNLKLLDDQ